MRKLNKAILNRLRFQVPKYFRTYYSEIRKLLSEHDDPSDSIPHYFKGYKRLDTTVCEDGVVIAHFKAEGADRDQFRYYLNLDGQVKDVLDIYKPDVPPEDPPQYIQPLLRDYEPGEDFGFVIHQGPLQRRTPLDASKEVIEETWWVRLDIASASCLDLWADPKEARRSARTLFFHNLRA